MLTPHPWVGIQLHHHHNLNCKPKSLSAWITIFTMMSNSPANIHSLPNEILTEVFLLSIPPLHHTTFIEENVRYFTMRVALRRVCRHWNNLICSTPRFWNSFLASDAVDSTIPPPVGLWQLSLQRSALVPLELMLVGNIEAELRLDDDAYPSGVHWKFLDVIATTKQRWRKLYLILKAQDILEFFSYLSQTGKAQGIEEVFVDSSSYSEEEFIDLFYKVITIPSLRRLHWHAISHNAHEEIEDWPSRFEPYLHNLTHLDLNSNITREELMLLIQLCTSLTCLRISQPFRSPTGEYELENIAAPNDEYEYEYQEMNTISHPSLHVLDLDESDAMLYILDYFEFPNLEVLNVRSVANHVFHTCMQLVDRLPSAKVHEKCSLKVLRVETDGCEFSPQDIPYFLIQVHSFDIPIVEVDVPATHVVVQGMDRDILEILQVLPKSYTERDKTILGWTDRKVQICQENRGYLSDCDIRLRIE